MRGRLAVLLYFDVMRIIFTIFVKRSFTYVDSVTDVRVMYTVYPDDCLPTTWYWKYRAWNWFVGTGLGRRWWIVRCYANRLVEHNYFEMFIVAVIVASSVTLVKSADFFFEARALEGRVCMCVKTMSNRKNSKTMQ